MTQDQSIVVNNHNVKQHNAHQVPAVDGGYLYGVYRVAQKVSRYLLVATYHELIHPERPPLTLKYIQY